MINNICTYYYCKLYLLLYNFKNINSNYNNVQLNYDLRTIDIDDLHILEAIEKTIFKSVLENLKF